MFTRRFYPVLALLAGLPALYGQPSASAPGAPGDIRVVVLDEAGKPASGIGVVASAVVPGAKPGAPAVSTLNGEAVIRGVPPGSYRLCVNAPGTAYLDPCRWATPAQAMLSAGQTSSGATLRLERGSVLRVTISDLSKRYLDQTSGPGVPPLMVGVYTTSMMYYSLALRSAGPGIRTFEGAIPFETPGTVSIGGGALQLADEKGRRLSGPTATTQVRHSAGKANPDLVFTVTGRQ